MRLLLLPLFFCLLLTGCGTPLGKLAPVEEIRWRPQNLYRSFHVVEKGETLYAIAFRYDKDYRNLAEFNHIRFPYKVRTGQIIRIMTRRRPVLSPSVKKRTVTPPIPTHSMHAPWQWPAEGRVVAHFSPLQGKKGIDIASKKGTSIHASARGIVAYAGNGLHGYGNLIIIKHDRQYLTAYGNNLQNLVKVGQHVQAGQVIAQMGMIDRRYWGVHFEIRQKGQPVNPLLYLRR
jgi:lipoprotein NlpD